MLRQEYRTLEKLQAELLESDPKSRQAVRLQRKLDRIAGEFVLLNKGLAGAVAKTFTGMSGKADADDYVSAGLMGLWEAFRTWDPEQATFGTFSRVYIEGAVKRAVRNNEATEISYGDFSARPKVTQAREALEAAGCDSTDLSAVAEQAGVTKALAERVTKERPTSLDAPVGDGVTRGDLISEPAATSVLDEENPEALMETITALELSPVENWVAIRRYGLDGIPAQNQISIARTIGYGRQSLQRVAYRVESALHPEQATVSS